MAVGVHQITADFEDALCKYTGAKYAVALDNMSNALFLALYYEIHIAKAFTGQSKPEIYIPKHTYPSVPAEIIHAGAKVKFNDSMHAGLYTGAKLKGTNSKYIKGAYNLYPTKVWDSALRFTHNMYQYGTHMCLSFTGPYKHLKLGKGGAILTDDGEAYDWFKKARFSGRDECSYHFDNFDKNPVLGWNFYMMPELAARGLLLINQFYDIEGNPKKNEDIALPYPDLSQYNLYKNDSDFR